MGIIGLGIADDETLQQIKNLRLMDDVLMVKCFEDNPKCTELLLGLIFKKSDFQVNRVKAMWHGPSVGLAILAKNRGWRYQIRVFRDDTADKKRKPGVDLYAAEHTAALAGIDYKIAAHFVIYIVEHGATRKPIDSGGILLDGWNEHGHCGFGTSAFYVNCDRKNKSPLGQLMYDFSCTDPSYMNYPILADRVRYFKENRQGIRDMCEILEQKRQHIQNCEAPKDLT